MLCFIAGQHASWYGTTKQQQQQMQGAPLGVGQLAIAQNHRFCPNCCDFAKDKFNVEILM